MLRFLLALCLMTMGLSQAAAPEGPPDKDNRRYGKTLVAEHRIDQATLERMRQHVPSAPDPKRSKAENLMTADTVNWVGPPVRLDPGQNPWGLVITLVATAQADGDASSTWLAGWTSESDNGGRVSPVSGLGKPNAKAGERFTVTVRPGSLMPKEAWTAMPYLGLVKSSNLRIEAVHAQVWTGLPGNTWRDYLFAFETALVGLVMLLLWWWFRR